MRIAKRLAGAVTGVSALALVGATVPASAQMGQGYQTPKKQKNSVVQLEQKSGAAVDVTTELDCSTHTLAAKVTNKTEGDITPNVTFNGKTPTFPSNIPIEPGKTGVFTYNFSGNHVMTKVSVAVGAYDAVELSPTLHCSEPITFTVSATSESAITGYLQNNSSFVSQTVLLRVGMGDIRTEILDPGESRLVALPFTGYEGQEVAFTMVGTATGFESSYAVDLNTPIVTPKK